MKRPVLSIQTVYFHDSDREMAARLGGALYERLTRPVADPLAHGPAIPVLSAVHADQVDLDAADTTVLVPVLGKSTHGLIEDKILADSNRMARDAGPGPCAAGAGIGKLARRGRRSARQADPDDAQQRR